VKKEPETQKQEEPVAEEQPEPEQPEANGIENGHEEEPKAENGEENGENKLETNLVLEKVTEPANGQQQKVESDDEDDGKGWINPDNISKKLYNAGKKDDRVKEIGVSIMTTDYAMQVHEKIFL
jgi:rRNA maturation endonuclease Nob1